MKTHNIPFSSEIKKKKKKKKKITLNYLKSGARWFFFSKGLKNEFETAVVKRAISVPAIEVLLYILSWMLFAFLVFYMF